MHVSGSFHEFRRGIADFDVLKGSILKMWKLRRVCSSRRILHERTKGFARRRGSVQFWRRRRPAQHRGRPSGRKEKNWAFPVVTDRVLFPVFCDVVGRVAWQRWPAIIFASLVSFNGRWNAFGSRFQFEVSVAVSGPTLLRWILLR